MNDAASPARSGTTTPVVALSIEADVAGGPGAARRARNLVHRQLAGRVPARLLDDIALMVTELVANGVHHGGAGVNSALHLHLEADAAVVRVEIEDPGRWPQAVAPRRPGGDGGGGIGLQLVDRLATRWGVGDGPHTSVWFELDCR